MSKRRFTEQSWQDDPWFEALVSSLCLQRSKQDMKTFLRDIGTLSELQAWSERLEVAKQLSRGLSYREVSKNTGASTTTVTRVARFIDSGMGGYRRFLKIENKQEQDTELSALEKIKQRRPSQQHHTDTSGEERSGPALTKYL